MSNLALLAQVDKYMFFYKINTFKEFDHINV